ncbi:uncharacterized protein ColSpa_08787 [Colletotrichum spaethianum]|uniref:Uncharacterized protein n=1 Tax=Colletotrichum spaethianum TaxID=700344 RepID=A0AA37PAC8_9PEZI|nr:uncharacterized protein ColSpa_08787 [Colletotrichum spaethianum]GKT48606.1 hypothetical protein ColSpa_08787 [Colletotrichum spaethianum]
MPSLADLIDWGLRAVNNAGLRQQQWMTSNCESRDTVEPSMRFRSALNHCLKPVVSAWTLEMVMAADFVPTRNIAMAWRFLIV